MGTEESSRLPSPLGAITETAPWLITGVLVIVGALTVAIYGLPFESKADGQRNDAQVGQMSQVIDHLADKVNNIQSDDAVMQETLRNLATNEAEIVELRKVQQDQAIQIEGLTAKINQELGRGR